MPQRQQEAKVKEFSIFSAFYRKDTHIPRPMHKRDNCIDESGKGSAELRNVRCIFI